MRVPCLMILHTCKRLPYVEDLRLPVKILPPEPQQLTTSESHHEECQEGRIEAMSLKGWQELCCHLPNGEGASFLAPLPWWLDQSAHIPHHKLVFFGARQCIREGDMMELDRLRL